MGYTITFSASPSAGGSVTGKYESSGGSQIEFSSPQSYSTTHDLQFKATANSNYTFEKFTVTYDGTTTTVTSNPFYKSG